MKYEFIKKEEDVTVLKYKEKEYEIKKTPCFLARCFEFYFLINFNVGQREH